MGKNENHSQQLTRGSAPIGKRESQLYGGENNGIRYVSSK
jgi:hypothetical protein